MSGGNVVALGAVVDLQAGVGFPPDLQGRSTGDYPLAKVGDISRVGRSGAVTMMSADNFVSRSDLSRLRMRPIPAGSVLFAKIGEAIRQNHRVITGCEVLIDNNAMAAIPSKDVDGRYLLHFLRTVDFYALASATTVPSLRKSDLQRIMMPLPPLVEQRRIAAILDQADALRAKRRTALAHLDTLAQSIFLDMFGDPATNPMGWPRRSLADVFDIARGGSPRPIDDFITDSPDGINWVMIGDASEGGGKYISRTRKRIKPEGARRSRAVKPGDFLLTNSMSFGRPYIMKTSGCIHDGWLVLSPRDGTFVPEYFYRLLGSSAVYAEFARLAPGATVKNLNIDLVRSVEVPVAPPDRQLEFARRADALERVRDSSSISLAALNEQFLSLQRKAFEDDAFGLVEAR